MWFRPLISKTNTFTTFIIKMGSEETRQRKIEWMNMVLDVGFDKDQCLDKKKLLAEFCLQCRSSRRTGLELLKIFEDKGKIRIDGDDIVITEKGY